jgi:hypothetical protein
LHQSFWFRNILVSPAYTEQSATFYNGTDQKVKLFNLTKNTECQLYLVMTARRLWFMGLSYPEVTRAVVLAVVMLVTW